MRLIKIACAIFCGAGYCQGSISQSATNSVLPMVQDFSSATAGVLLPQTSLVGTVFAGVTLTSNTQLYYDPNGIGNCNLGKEGQEGRVVPSLSGLSYCVGDYSLANVASAVPLNQATPQPNLVALGDPEITLQFTTAAYGVSMFFAVPGGTNVYPTLVKVCNTADCSSPIETAVMLGGLTSINEYMNISEQTPFKFIELSFIPGSYNTYDVLGHTWNALIGDVEEATALTPEPGSTVLICIGLATLGCMFRRRRA